VVDIGVDSSRIGFAATRAEGHDAGHLVVTDERAARVTLAAVHLGVGLVVGAEHARVAPAQLLSAEGVWQDFHIAIDDLIRKWAELNRKGVR